MVGVVQKGREQINAAGKGMDVSSLGLPGFENDQGNFDQWFI